MVALKVAMSTPEGNALSGLLAMALIASVSRLTASIACSESNDSPPVPINSISSAPTSARSWSGWGTEFGVQPRSESNPWSLTGVCAASISGASAVTSSSVMSRSASISPVQASAW